MRRRPSPSRNPPARSKASEPTAPLEYLLNGTGAGEWGRTTNRRRVGFGAGLSGSYKGGQPPCTIPMKGAHPLHIPQVAGSPTCLVMLEDGGTGAGEWGRTTDLLITNPVKDRPQQIQEDQSRDNSEAEE